MGREEEMLGWPRPEDRAHGTGLGDIHQEKEGIAYAKAQKKTAELPTSKEAGGTRAAVSPPPTPRKRDSNKPAAWLENRRLTTIQAANTVIPTTLVPLAAAMCSRK